MKLESLLEKTYNEKYQDFKQCEKDWESDSSLTEASLKGLIASTRDFLEQFHPEQDILEYDWETAVKNLNDGMVIRTLFQFVRLKNKLSKCPLCGSSFDEDTYHYSISRRDNETKICYRCGMGEAFSDFTKSR